MRNWISLAQGISSLAVEAGALGGQKHARTSRKPDFMAERLRNLAIIAHVDHGKTTLVDQLLTQGGAFRANEARQERAMGSNGQERERGKEPHARAGEAGEARALLDSAGQHGHERGAHTLARSHRVGTHPFNTTTAPTFP